VFLFGGEALLDALQLKQESVSIAGGIILFLIGIRMIFPVREGLFGESPDGEPFIVPLAIPGIAGPSTMATLMLLGHDAPTRQVDWSIALLLAWGGTAVILFAATTLYRFLGIRVITALERLMGMLLVAVSVQMFLDGIRTYLAH
jgi:multiple antibiotic resistance protein